MIVLKKIAVYFIVASLLIVGLSSYGFAFGGRGGHGFGMAGHGYMTWGYNQNVYQANPLDLTEEQQEKLAELQEEFITESNELRSDLWDKQTELHEKIYEGASTQVIDALKVQINKFQEQLLDFQIGHLTKTSDILTDEQLEEVKEFYTDNNTFGRVYRGLGGRGFAGPGFGGPGFGGRGMMGGWYW